MQQYNSCNFQPDLNQLLSIAVKKQPLLFFISLVVYFAALTAIVAKVRDNVMRKIN
ncbi:hypothetical protein [Kosakonia sp. CFBP8986]|uniref:hypothetical protein n=1 Tax=Kosakonia TaxID=1330547 RepID=UPI003BB88F8F